MLSTTSAPPPNVRRAPVSSPLKPMVSTHDKHPVQTGSNSHASHAHEKLGSLKENISQKGPVNLRAAAVAAQVQNTNTARNNTEISDEQKAELSALKARDREVRAHEQAHAFSGAGYTSAPQYDYVKGPDGRQYAVGGSVEIDTSTVPDDPRATIEKMEIVLSAALAPASPSGPDRAVAAAAERAIRSAEALLRSEESEEKEAPQKDVDGQNSQVDAIVAATTFKGLDVTV